MSAAQNIERPLLSVVTPAFNEAANLPLLYDRLKSSLEGKGVDWEWIVVDDHSRDGTFDVIKDLARRDQRVRGIRFARNSGAHTAIASGLQIAHGNCAVVMAADLQDPPETLDALIAKWKDGAQVVWAVHGNRVGEPAAKVGFSRLYFFIIRRIVGLRDIPPTGTDIFLIDRLVIDALRQFGEHNVSIMALITWLGFRQDQIVYDKQARAGGTSGWSLEKKLKLAIDSITSFTYLPIRLMSMIGFMFALFGFMYAIVVVVNFLVGNPTQGWSSLMVVVLVVGGLQMLMMGILGEYLWRSLDESRRRPRFIVEATCGVAPSSRAT